MYPPEAWIQDCPAPTYLTGQPWIYLPEYTRALQDTAECDKCDKAKLRAWRMGEKIPECNEKARQ